MKYFVLKFAICGKAGINTWMDLNLWCVNETIIKSAKQALFFCAICCVVACISLCNIIVVKH